MKKLLVYIFLACTCSGMLISCGNAKDKSVIETENVTEETVTKEIEDAAEQTLTPEPEQKSEEVPTEEKLLQEIYSQNKEYEDYTVEIFTDDFDGDSNNEYFYVFTEKGTSKEDYLNYYAEIWFGSSNGVVRALEWSYIDPNKTGALLLGSHKYFRYDLTYATENQSVLLGVEDKTCKTVWTAGGEIGKVSGTDFQVLCSSYDMLCLKGDDFYTGHSIKNYYFYVDQEGFHEYKAVEIDKQEFFTFGESIKIYNELKEQYNSSEGKADFQFLKRENGLIHINVTVEALEDISNYYVTYQLSEENSLLYQEEGQGKYGVTRDSVVLETEYEDTEEEAELKTWTVVGDFAEINRENLQGTWYNPEMDEELIITEEGCRVVIPYLDFYGEEVYEYDVVNRSDRGLCPALYIYFNGKNAGPLAYYIFGVNENYFWCNGQQALFSKQQSEMKIEED
ncbi:hypothetical protein [Anaeromicropila populeti]|uniref:Uncharacterized protein n=1 Tax=Anaeromicropila populeti TaxID=37658 RepID=A0A1I6K005_9FIRM|nr:hypothetical protein [Anaeromicropila populeti]SFR84569.1 hypothetical protein SAMN05661086_02140 [Anaeromicropila populeti]